MLAIVIDTSVGACTVGLYEKGRNGLICLYEDMAPMTRGHQEHIGPQVLQCFHETRIKPKALDRVCVTLGPGSFTGLRVGLSFAKGLAGGLNVPLRGFSTLEALAAGEGLTDEPTLAVIEAGRGQVYLQVFDGMAGLTKPKALNINHNDDIQAFSASHPSLKILTGSGLDHLTPYWPDAKAIPRIGPSPEAMACLAFDESDRSDVRPVYIRAPDAKISDKRIVRFGSEA